jgi:hypothetical protein
VAIELSGSIVMPLDLADYQDPAMEASGSEAISTMS